MNKRLRRHKRNALSKRVLLIGGISVAVVLAVFLGLYISIRSTVNKVAENIIWDNIYIEGVDVSGMTDKEAKKALEEQISKYQSEKATVIADEQETKLSLRKKNQEETKGT